MGDDGEHTGQRPCALGVDAEDAGVRVVGVAERGVELARQREVGGVATGPGHLLAPVGADEARSSLLDGGHAAIQPRRRPPARALQSSAVTTSPELARRGVTTLVSNHHKRLRLAA